MLLSELALFIVALGRQQWPPLAARQRDLQRITKAGSNWVVGLTARTGSNRLLPGDRQLAVRHIVSLLNDLLHLPCAGHHVLRHVGVCGAAPAEGVAVQVGVGAS